jgi:hypothetical protein
MNSLIYWIKTKKRETFAVLMTHDLTELLIPSKPLSNCGEPFVILLDVSSWAAAWVQFLIGGKTGVTMSKARRI